MLRISVVINSLNQEKDIERAIKSVKWANEIIVCDMQSTDNTASSAKKLGAKVFNTKRLEYVEPARNLAISKATSEWVLVIDPDEEISESLKDKLEQIVSESAEIDYVRIPRQNIIFGKWMKASMWWPDYNIRFFKKGKIEWMDKIHSSPKVTGKGLDLDAVEKFAIIHHHYLSISQFLDRMLRYTKVQADELKAEGYKFNWQDLIKKPLNEFLGRFFANRGFEDGLHGLVLALLQAFSFMIVYLRLWEMEGFNTQQLDLKEVKQMAKQSGSDLNYWFKYGNLSNNYVKRFLQKVRNKI